MNQEEIVEKELVVKVGPEARIVAEKILSDVNSRENYPKKVSFKELFEYLLHNPSTDYLSDLVKFRIQPEDTLRMMYHNSNSTLSYPEWLLTRVEALEALEKKTIKKKSAGGSSV